MRILVTGASGFIGSGLVEALSKAGHEVCALLRPTASTEFLKGVPFTRLSGDITDPSSLSRACTNMDVVYHLAGVTSARTRDEYFRLNAEGTKNIAIAAAKSGSVKKFIYVSSQAASGPSSGLCPKTETESDHPVSMYGESKLRGELYLDELKGQLPFIVVRPPMVYGPRDKAIFLFFKSISKQWMPLLPARTPTGHKYYSAIHVDDLISALLKCLAAPEELFQRGERFFVSDGQIYTAERIFSVIANELRVKPIRVKIPTSLMNALASGGSLLSKVLKKNIPINRDRVKDLVPDYWICSSQKAFDRLDFKPYYTMESGVPHAIAWYKVHGWL